MDEITESIPSPGINKGLSLAEVAAIAYRHGPITLRLALTIGICTDTIKTFLKRPCGSPQGRFFLVFPLQKGTLKMNTYHASTGLSIEGLGYTRHGTGPERVLALHDWLGDHSSYDSVIPYLDGAMFSYVFADLRGYGKSIQLTGNYTIQEIAADCLKLADSLGWQRFHLLGHSMTGMAVQRITADAPSRIKSVIAVCPISAAGNPLNDEALNFFASTGESDDNFCRLIKYVSGGLSDQWAKVKLRQNRETVSPACRLGYLTMFTKTNFVDDVRGLETPYLIVIAERDPGLDEELMTKTFLSWYPNAELLTIPNCGHYPMQECPPYFATIVEKFLHREIK